MHEMALAEGVLAVALDMGGGQPVKRIELRVGELQRVVPDVLQFGFGLAAAGTAAAEAALEIEHVKALFGCRACNVVSDWDGLPFICQRCGAADYKVVSGDEFHVLGLELPDGWRRPSQARLAAEIPPEHLMEHALGLTEEEVFGSG